MKLSPLTIILLGLSISIGVLSFALFHHYLPNKATTENLLTQVDLLKTEAGKQKRAEQRVLKAVEMVQLKADEWQAVVAAHTPPHGLGAGGIDLARNRWQLVIDARKFRNEVQRDLNRQLRRGGVTVENGPTIPFPSTSATNVVETYFNYPSIRFPVAIYDLGTVSVRGTFDQIDQHVRAWSTMPNYLAVTDGLRITGTSPNLLATYNLSLVAYIRGETVSPPVPEGAAPASGSGGGPGTPGFGGGGGGGPRGGPPPPDL
ncbi:MAG: hypothetical protein HONBIEJF_01133 [Fimbriimonadaceae bacterium]|nr:hypothetical protein [Fimbriimonadaceae bacterium]